MTRQLHLPWEEIILIKLSLSIAFFAVFIVPPPFDMPAAAMVNLVWLWRT